MNRESRALKDMVPSSTESARIIGKIEIKSILPHRKRMLLLDEVLVADGKITGKFTVTKEVCEGHAVLDGELVLKGSDFLDMAAQLLAVWGSQYVDFRGKTCLVRKYGQVKFSNNPVLPGNLLTMELGTEKVKIKTLASRGLTIIKGETFSAKVKKQQRAEILFVELVLFD